MRIAPALLACLLLAMATVGCSDGSHSSGRQRQSTSEGGPSGTSTGGNMPYSSADFDYDEDDAHPPAHAGFDDAPLLRLYGRPAAPVDKSAIAAVVRRYYAVSLAGEAASACALLSSPLVTGLASEHGQGTGGGDTRSACSASLSRQLTEQHARLVSEDPATMRVVSVYAKPGAAIAVLRFKAAPESEIVLAREGGRWKIDALFGSYMT